MRSPTDRVKPGTFSRRVLSGISAVCALVLVDRRGEIRGYHLHEDDEAQARLRADLTSLLRQPAS